jgi:HK97 gp10 family phage protein
MRLIIDKNKLREVIDNSPRKYFREVVINMTEDAKQLCPVAVENGGTLRDSIKNDINLEEKKATISANTEYAVFVELGTSKQPAQPYLRGAIKPI